MTNSVLDILIYVFDRYMLDEAPDVPERDDLARDLTLMGFRPANVERALDWLLDLAGAQTQYHQPSDRHPNRPEEPARQRTSIRLYTDSEAARLSIACRGQLMSLERQGVLSSAQRELVLDRMLALDTDELDVEQLKWVVLMVLSSQPGQEQAFARMEDLMVNTCGHPPH